MSILIKGMEMPKENDYTIAIVYGDGVVTEYHEDYRIRGTDGEKQLGTAVPVPKHGRLIDADALAEANERSFNAFLENGEITPHEAGVAYVWASEEIRRAPTIIPAEEGE